MAEIKMTGFRV